MTREDIIHLAREAGVFSGANEKVFSESLERFAALVAAHERKKPVQVSPLEFVEAVLEKEHLVGKYWQPLYTAPRPWVGLTMADMAKLRMNGLHTISDKHFKTIEETLKEKNK